MNSILSDFANEHGLPVTTAFYDRPKDSDYTLGVWNGQRFVFTQDSSSSKPWDIAKMLWKYGLSPIRTYRLTKLAVGRFLEMYHAPVFPFRSLDDAVQRVGLLDYTAATGRELLKKHGISDKFAREIVQASTRVNYGQNLAGIHGLETLVCMAADGARSVRGGNWQIFDLMTKESGADVRLSTVVTDVLTAEDGACIVTSKTSSADEATGSTQEQQQQQQQQQQEFDTIVMAAPHQFSNITFTPPLAHKPKEIPYVDLHVTLFTSPHRLDPQRFNLPSQEHLPEMLITTLPEDLNMGNATGKAEVGPMSFWSISTLRRIQIHDDDHPIGQNTLQRTQYLYKVFSPERLRPRWLASMLGVDFSGREEDGISSMSGVDVSWSHEKVWHSYPYEFPRLTFEEIRLARGDKPGKGIWYTAGIESLISTMETSALMGKNVARLIIDEVRLEGCDEKRIEL